MLGIFIITMQLKQKWFIELDCMRSLTDSRPMEDISERLLSVPERGFDHAIKVGGKYGPPCNQGQMSNCALGNRGWILL